MNASDCAEVAVGSPCQGAVFVKVVVACTRFHAALLTGTAMGPPPPASWGSASAAPWPLHPASGLSGLSQTGSDAGGGRILR